MIRIALCALLLATGTATAQEAPAPTAELSLPAIGLVGEGPIVVTVEGEPSPGMEDMITMLELGSKPLGIVNYANTERVANFALPEGFTLADGSTSITLPPSSTTQVEFAYAPPPLPEGKRFVGVREIAAVSVEGDPGVHEFSITGMMMSVNNHAPMMMPMFR